MPTAEQIKNARRLITTAELLSIRLVRSSADCLIPPRPPRAQGPQPRIFVRASAPQTSAKLLAADRLLAKAKFRLIARLGTSPDSQLALKLAGTFELQYTLPHDLNPGRGEVTAFCKTNVMLNSWPYWRELVQNTVSRMSLPPLILPLFRLAPPLSTGRGLGKPLEPNTLTKKLP
jgi:hypothetical protein